MIRAVALAGLCTRLKHWTRAKRNTSCLIKKAWRCATDRTSKTTTSFVFYITQRSYEKIMCIVIWLVQWWKLYYIYIFLIQRTADFDRLQRNMSGGTIAFLTSLLIALTWNILLLFSFWQKDNFMFWIKTLFFSFNLSY